MPLRKIVLANSEIYHICSKSIAGFRIFNTNRDFLRMMNLLTYYNTSNPICKYSCFHIAKKNIGANPNDHFDSANSLVDICAFCLMPTHIHLVLKQLTDGGISIFMNRILKSYSLYFNRLHKRKGPLWEGRFKNILVDSEEYLLHLTRYIHLNPTSADLENNPEQWNYSSYREFLGIAPRKISDLSFFENLHLTTDQYKKFVDDRKDYQKTLHKIKHLLLE